LEYVIRRVQENKEVLKGTQQLLAYTDDINILGENKGIIQKNTEAQLDANKETGLEENTKKTKCMFMSRCKKAGQKRA
jgi:hypothetical protein